MSLSIKALRSLFFSLLIFFLASGKVYAAEFIWLGRPVRERIEDLIVFLLRIAAAFALLALIGSGITYAFSSGNPQLSDKAKKIFINAILGILVIIMSYAFLVFMNQLLTQ